MPRSAAMMRTVLGLLVATTGCNYVFGIGETRPADEVGPGIDAPPIPAAYSSLSWAIAQTDGQGSPDSEILYAAIGSESVRPELPVIMIGPALGAGDLMPTTYHIDPVTDANGVEFIGGFDIPVALRGAAHRIVYTVPGDPVPTEIQAVTTGAQIALPRSTRLGAIAAPPGSGYQMTPMGIPGAATFNRFFTTGVFSEIYDNQENQTPMEFSGQNLRTATVRDWPAKAVMLTGPAAGPDPTQGDKVVYVAYTGGNADIYSSGYAIAEIPLVANTVSTDSPEPVWNSAASTRSTVNPARRWPTFPWENTRSRMQNNLAALITVNRPSMCTYPVCWPRDYVGYGITPSSKMPPFAHGADGQPRPMLLPFYFTEQYTPTTQAFADPADMLPFERAVHGRSWSYRDTNGVRLVSAVDVFTTTLDATAQWSAPLAINAKLGATDISTNATDSTSIPAPTAKLVLTWEDEQDFTGHDYIVTLHEIANNTLTPVRRYRVIQRSVDIDHALLQAGHTYAFSIMSRKGLPNALMGDMKTISLPFSTATTFPRTITVAP